MSLDNEPRAVPHSLVKDLLLGNYLPESSAVLQTLKERFSYDYSNPPTTISLEIYIDLLDFVRQTMFPDKPVEQGYFLIAIASLNGHFQGPVGRINRIAIRMFSFEKAAELYLKTQRYNYPFGLHQIEEMRRGYLRYHRTNVPTPPAFTEGVLTHLLHLTGGKNVKVSSHSLKPGEVIYEARWDY